jgi:dTDP-4-dehydrorhamnose 3,5-epimerase
MEFSETTLPGCFLIQSRVFRDHRGGFVKTYHKEWFQKAGLSLELSEEFYSVSTKRVLRGLHFQLPPRDHVKFVYCPSGAVLDAVVDLRKGSPTFGKFATFQISEDEGNALFIPSGFAHGFFTLSEKAILVYKTSTVHSPEHDAGILWSSVGIPWPTEEPVLSVRDQKFAAFSDFVSPFNFATDGKGGIE